MYSIDTILKEISQLGLSQEQVADITGVAQSTVSRIIFGKTSKPRQKTLAQIAKALGVPPVSTHPALEVEISASMESLRSHLTMVQNWCSKIQISGMSAPKTVDDLFIEPEFKLIPNKFSETTSHKLNMANIIGDSHHYNILGAPGTGKTTFLRYIAASALKLYQNEKRPLPLVVRLREVDTNNTLLAYILKVFGIFARVDENYPESQAAQALRQYTSTVLDSFETILLLDGLDEVVLNYQQNIIEEIRYLFLNLRKSRIILTCRSDSFYYAFENCNIVELFPFSEVKVKEFVYRWLDEKQAQMLFDTINRAPYGGIEKNPLFLVSLCSIYSRFGYIPDQPSIFYRKLVSLYLEEWDQQRNVRRRSKYSNFTPERKYDFLANLAYELCSSGYESVIPKDRLIEIYEKICNVFRLPEHDGNEVIRDITSHTGLITQVGLDTFSFTHRSIQEYLAANYLVRLPLFSSTIIMNMPNEVAIATSISSDPTYFLIEVIKNISQRLELFGNSFILSYINRLVVECPNTGIEEKICILLLLLHYRNYLDEPNRSKTIDSKIEAIDFEFLINRSQFSYYFKILNNSDKIIIENKDMVIRIQHPTKDGWIFDAAKAIIGQFVEPIKIPMESFDFNLNLGVGG